MKAYKGVPKLKIALFKLAKEIKKLFFNLCLFLETCLVKKQRYLSLYI